MNMICQTTIARSTAISGIGLHTGQRINMTLRPAEAGTGIVFHRKVEVRHHTDQNSGRSVDNIVVVEAPNFRPLPLQVVRVY